MINGRCKIQVDPMSIFDLNLAQHKFVPFVLFPHSASLLHHPIYFIFTCTVTHLTKNFSKINKKPELPPSSPSCALIPGMVFWQVPAKRHQVSAWSKNTAS